MNYKVYLIKTSDNRIYVGCTKLTLPKRIAVHKYRKKEFVLQPYSIEVVFESDSESPAIQKEAELIAHFDSTDPTKGYNRRYGGSDFGFPKYVNFSRDVKKEKNPLFGKKHSLETREKLRQKALARDSSTFEKNRHKTPEQLAKLHAGRERSQKIHGHPRKGIKHSEESKRKMRETRRLRYLNKLSLQP